MAAPSDNVSNGVTAERRDAVHDIKGSRNRERVERSSSCDPTKGKVREPLEIRSRQPLLYRWPGWTCMHTLHRGLLTKKNIGIVQAAVTYVVRNTPGSRRAEPTYIYLLNNQPDIIHLDTRCCTFHLLPRIEKRTLRADTSKLPRTDAHFRLAAFANETS